MITETRLKLTPLLLVAAALASCSSGADKGDLTDALEKGGLTGDQAACVVDRLDDELTSEQLDNAARADTQADLDKAIGLDASGKLSGWVAECIVADSTGETDPVDSDVSSADPTGTASPATEPVSTRAPSSRQAPIPLGTATDVADGWTVTIQRYNADATADVATANEFNTAAPAGSRYVTATVDAAYAGTDDKHPLYTVSFSAVGPSGATYQASDCYATLAQPVDMFADVFAGSSVSGDLCFVVGEADADALVLYTDAIGDDYTTVTTYFATA